MTSSEAISQLRQIAAFSDLPDDVLAWLVEKSELEHYRPGEVLNAEGSPAVYMVVVLEGEIYGKRETSHDDGRTYRAVAGQVTGLLPFSRLKDYPLTTRAVLPTTVLRLHMSHFDEMLRLAPQLAPRLVAMLTDRVRDVTRSDQQREKMAALGKLSAGLAHELNNPAAAARRAASAMREAAQTLQRVDTALANRELTCDQRRILAGFDRDAKTTVIDSLERSDREEEFALWMEKHGIPDPWSLAPDLVEAGAEIPQLEQLRSQFQGDLLPLVLQRLACSSTLARLAGDVEASTQRISELVKAIKEYSYMDQAPEQEIDVHEGIENTLVLLRYRLKHGIELERDYDRSAPRVCARGSELNQVWTNLIDNAVDAMGGKGSLRIHTFQEPCSLVVEIGDSGPGVPEEIKDRIFEPFFTTKQVGSGTGLGLDTVYRIVRQHKGEIRLISKPGDTRFQVRLPAAKASSTKEASNAGM